MTQDLVLLVIVAVVVLIAAGFTMLFASLRRSARSAVLTAARTPIRFRPMGRLLNEADFEFLAKQPGYRPEIGRQLRVRRVALFQTYLNHLAVEFHDLHRKLRILSLYSPVDRADLSRLLVEQRLLFGFRMFEIRLRLLFFRFGMKPVDVSGMVEVVENMRQQVAEMSAGLAAPTASATA